MDPPVIVEITSVLHSRDKIDKFLKKKEFVDALYGTIFRGFFVAAGTDFNAETTADIIIQLKSQRCEYLNL